VRWIQLIDLGGLLEHSGHELGASYVVDTSASDDRGSVHDADSSQDPSAGQDAGAIHDASAIQLVGYPPGTRRR
jgi:hypothetical protein